MKQEYHLKTDQGTLVLSTDFRAIELLLDTVQLQAWMKDWDGEGE